MSLITSEDCVAIFGSGGMVGSAISRALNSSGYANQLLLSQRARSSGSCCGVSVVFSTSTFCSCSSKSRGIHANATFPADFLLENLKIQTVSSRRLAGWGVVVVSW